MMPDSGRPSAPPMPRVALIRATAEPTFSFGSSSRMMLMAIGISAAAKPCSERPMITVRKTAADGGDDRTGRHRDHAQEHHQPLAEHVGEPGHDRRRDGSGQQRRGDQPGGVVGRLTPRMPEKSGSSGTTIVCCSATTVPHSDRMR